MFLVLGECRNNANRAARLYAERYPNRRHPDVNVIRRLDQRVRETGNVIPNAGPDRGRPRNVLRPLIEEEILEILEQQPTSSTRSIAQQVGVSQSNCTKFICSEGYHPYHYTKVQSLLPNDFELRVNFCNWLLQRVAENNLFTSRVLWTDEANFTRDGCFNQHNSHHYGLENPHLPFEHHHQQRFSVNVWAGILGNNLIGPIILPHRLNGENFLDFLQNQLQERLEDVPLAAIQHMWMQLDGAPAHFAGPVRVWLDREFPERWIGRNGPVSWPPRSPDITPLDFFFWGYIKGLVYRTPVQNQQDLIDRIQHAAETVNIQMLQRVQRNVVRRAQICLEAGGQNFEHFI